MLVALSIMGGGFILIGKWLMAESFKIMPFRVYEGGITKTSVPFRDGLEGREVFVPAGDVEKVTFESMYAPKVGMVYFYLFHLSDGDRFSISDKDMEEVRPILRDVLRCPIEGSS